MKKINLKQATIKIRNNTSLYDYYKPALFYSLISNVQAIKSELDAEKGIDMYFLEKAKKDKKEIIELESAMYQYNMLASFPDEMYDYMIKYSILNDEYMVESTKKLYEAWLAGNVDDIIMYSMGEDEYVEQGTYDEYKNVDSLMEDYNEKLIYVRNREMTEKIDDYFKDDKDIFLVVGIGHIVGEDGIVDLLTELDYNINLIAY